ncbi:MAG: V-type ATP synthase subunit E [Lachnospiraceae bacterium]|jgi:V/A-type H+-transporting ATPase subunit E|nr:V-type ATP synthase subunit E [Lachnospiraceae bacterium]
MGIDKILEDIRTEADETAADIMTAAGTKADAIRRDGEEAAQKAADAIAAENAKKIAGMKARSASSLTLRKRQRILEAKQKLIAETMEAVLKQVDEMPDDRYFSVLAAMAARAAHSGQGTIAFGRRDLSRLPEDFAVHLAEKLPAGAVLKTAQDPADIRSGFVLSYDGIEENCSFEALLSERREELQDLVAGILFKG